MCLPRVLLREKSFFYSFSLRMALHRIYKTKTNKFWIYRSGNYDNSMYLIIFHSLHLHLYWQGCNTHKKKCWNTRWVNELVPWKTQFCYFYRNNNAGATMLISCGTKEIRSIYMANTVSKKRNEKGKPLRMAIDCLLRSFTVCSSL